MTCQLKLAKITFNVDLEAYALMVFVSQNVPAQLEIVCPMKFAKTEFAKEFAAITNSVQITKFALIECVLTVA